MRKWTSFRQLPFECWYHRWTADAYYCSSLGKVLPHPGHLIKAGKSLKRSWSCSFVFRRVDLKCRELEGRRTAQGVQSKELGDGSCKEDIGSGILYCQRRFIVIIAEKSSPPSSTTASNTWTQFLIEKFHHEGVVLNRHGEGIKGWGTPDKGRTCTCHLYKTAVDVKSRKQVMFVWFTSALTLLAYTKAAPGRDITSS